MPVLEPKRGKIVCLTADYFVLLSVEPSFDVCSILQSTFAGRCDEREASVIYLEMAGH